MSYAPYPDLLWCETSEPNVDEAKKFADAIHDRFPGKPLAYNCSPSFNWKKKLDAASIATFQRELAAMGYKFQFVTLAGFHAPHAGLSVFCALSSPGSSFPRTPPKGPSTGSVASNRITTDPLDANAR